MPCRWASLLCTVEGGNTFAVSVVDAFASGRHADAMSLVFEYMAATQVETGRPRPADVDQLPAVLRRECEYLDHTYQPPGTLLLACRGEQAVGCVGIAPCRAVGAAEIKRLYVRPGHRGGIGRILMEQAHRHAARHRFTSVVLNVLPTRTAVLGCYRSLGYTEVEPYEVDSPLPMISLRRPIPKL